MAAIDIPWLSSLATPMSSRDDTTSLGGTPPTYDPQNSTGAPPTFAAFSPVTLSSTTPSRSSRRSTILVHQKSPLLLATPPQITRALAYSHPFLLPLNTFIGLLTWSSGDPWQSFLLLCAFWAVTLYGDVILKTAGPVVVGAGMIAGMYGRRYSPLSSSGWSEPAHKDTPGQTSTAKTAAADRQTKHQRGHSEVTNTKHQKTLDEIVETLKEFTGRCNVLLDPLLDLTDFLSTQTTPTSATTRPALTALFMRLLITTPFWIALTLPPWRVITTKRVVLVAGTLLLTWHAKVMRVTRVVLWRSATIRRAAATITGLRFDIPARTAREAPADEDKPVAQARESELTKALKTPTTRKVSSQRRSGPKSAGVKFTFIIYENQRRWVGLGWTSSLFAYERGPWTDEHNNAVPPKDEFELPDVEDGSKMQWRWADGSRWRVDGVQDDQGPVDYDAGDGKNGWIYYDSKWQNGRRGQDGWGRWTRRRKWYRDAELVEVDPSDLPPELDGSSPQTKSALQTQSYSTAGEKMITGMRAEPSVSHADRLSLDEAGNKAADDAISLQSTSSRSYFKPPSLRRKFTDRSTTDRERTRRESDVLSQEDASSLGIDLELELQKQGKEGGRWGIGDEARMGLE